MSLCIVKPRRVNSAYIKQRINANEERDLMYWGAWPQQTRWGVPTNTWGIGEPNYVETADIDRLHSMLTNGEVGGDPTGRKTSCLGSDSWEWLIEAIAIQIRFDHDEMMELIARYDMDVVRSVVCDIEGIFRDVVEGPCNVTQSLIGDDQPPGTAVFFTTYEGISDDTDPERTPVIADIIIMDVGLAEDGNKPMRPVWVEIWDLRRICEQLEARLEKHIRSTIADSFWAQEFNSEPYEQPPAAKPEPGISLAKAVAEPPRASVWELLTVRRRTYTAT